MVFLNISRPVGEIILKHFATTLLWNLNFPQFNIMEPQISTIY